MKTKRFTTLFLFLAILGMNLNGVAEVIKVPVPPPLTPKPQMSPATIMAKRKFYVAKYGQTKKKKLEGSRVENFSTENTPEDYSGWLSLALRDHPSTRYFKIKTEYHLAMRFGECVWVYDRQFRQLRYLHRASSFPPPNVKNYQIYKNVDDAAIHVLAEDAQPLDKVADYIQRRR